MQEYIDSLQASLRFTQGSYHRTIDELAEVVRASLLPDLTVNQSQKDQIGRLFGTTALEALYILRGLQLSFHVAGDVCEFGVAQGRTSALIALTLQNSGSQKRLWLYDSFEGLPEPTTKDVLLHDIHGLGSMSAYKGELATAEAELQNELDRINFPASQVEICRGWIEDSLLAGQYPDRISFAFLDMDFYKSTKQTLEMLVERMTIGGEVVIDDYGFFSSGVATAVKEIMDEYPGCWQFTHPFGYKFALLRRLQANLTY